MSADDSAQPTGSRKRARVSVSSNSEDVPEGDLSATLAADFGLGEVDGGDVAHSSATQLHGHEESAAPPLQTTEVEVLGAKKSASIPQVSAAVSTEDPVPIPLARASSSSHAATSAPPPKREKSKSDNSSEAPAPVPQPAPAATTAKHPQPAPAPVAHGKWQFKVDLRKKDTDAKAWSDYSDADSKIIEKQFLKAKALQEKGKAKLLGEVMISSEYGVHFDDMVQFRRDDRQKQRPVRRV
jgi:hypothetical protein